MESRRSCLPGEGESPPEAEVPRLVIFGRAERPPWGVRRNTSPSRGDGGQALRRDPRSRAAGVTPRTADRASKHARLRRSIGRRMPMERAGAEGSDRRSVRRVDDVGDRPRPEAQTTKGQRMRRRVLQVSAALRERAGRAGPPLQRGVNGGPRRGRNYKPVAFPISSIHTVMPGSSFGVGPVGSARMRKLLRS